MEEVLIAVPLEDQLAARSLVFQVRGVAGQDRGLSVEALNLHHAARRRTYLIRGCGQHSVTRAEAEWYCCLGCPILRRCDAEHGKKRTAMVKSAITGVRFMACLLSSQIPGACSPGSRWRLAHIEKKGNNAGMTIR